MSPAQGAAARRRRLADPVIVREDALEAFAAATLAAAGLDAAEAQLVAGYLVQANLRGVDGHGVVRLPQYVASIRAGGINLRPDVRVTRRDGATAVVDADGGYGFRPAQVAAGLAGELAESYGVGCVGVANSHHFGMALPFALRVAERGCVGLALSNTTAIMPAPGGLRPVVGNSPIAIAVPRAGEEPLAVDLALSSVSWGKIGLAAARGDAIPPGWALDRRGEPTTDAREALRASLLLPVGGHKGFALALLLELVAAGLTGSPVGPTADTHGSPDGGCGHLLLAIDPDRFGGRAAFSQRVEELAAAVAGSPASEGAAPPRLPGACSRAVRGRRLAEGIPIDEHLARELDALARGLGAPPLVAADREDCDEGNRQGA